MDAPTKLKTKTRKGVSYSLCSTYLFYDIVAEGATIDLEKVKEMHDSSSHIIKKGRWGSPIIVLDTSTELSDMEEEFDKI
ncbi:unnamed protein product [marine sediment metagenome]|uniref:Uncharacterized protein n=1 Tax=marine sediment metagenome TaxID=412755 RepID=X0YID6_9ZZZZ